MPSFSRQQFSSEQFDDVLRMAAERNVSDVMFAVGRTPLWRSTHKWLDIRRFEKLTAADTEFLADIILEDHVFGKEEKREFTSLVVGYEIKGVGRFRMSVYKQRDVYQLVARPIPSEILSFKDLNLPVEILTELVNLPRGLVLVAGGSSQGKSTTLASMIGCISREKRKFIITVEDPIEFTYPKDSAVITQREVGADIETFSQALRQSFRQQPDVMLIGEICDRETFDAALLAAETGRLVLGAINTEDTVRTLKRILSFYKRAEIGSLLDRINSSLKAIISQKLLPSQSGINGRIAAIEFMRMEDRIANSLLDGNSSDIMNLMIASYQQDNIKGMRPFYDDLVRLRQEGKISNDVVAAYSSPWDIRTKSN